MSTQIVRNKRRTDQREVRTAHVIRLGDGAGLPMLRTSERGTFKRCHWKWFHEFELQIKGKTSSPALRFGSLIHRALALYYKPGLKRGPNPVKSFQKFYAAELEEYAEFGVKEDDKWIDAGEMGEGMLQNYLDRYGADEEWEVVLTEQPFQIPVNNEFTYVGVMDGIWRNRRTKKLHIVDHKTAAAINPMYLSLDDQATAYWTWGLDWIYSNGLLNPKEKPSGMLFNFLRKAKPDDREQNALGEYLNKDGTVSKKQPPPYFARVPIYRDWAERESARERALIEFSEMQRIRAAALEEGSYETTVPPAIAYKNPGQFTCPGCWAFDFCELHEIGADWLELREAVTSRWNPYEDHETYASETK